MVILQNFCILLSKPELWKNYICSKFLLRLHPSLSIWIGVHQKGFAGISFFFFWFVKFIYSEKATKIWRNLNPNDHYILIIGRILWLWQSLSTTRRKLKIACYYHWHFDSRFSADNALVGPWTAIRNHNWKASTYQERRRVNYFSCKRVVDWARSRRSLLSIIYYH